MLVTFLMKLTHVQPEIPMPPAAPLPTFLVPGDIAGAHSILGKLDLGKIWSDVARRQKAAVTDDPEWDKASGKRLLTLILFQPIQG